MSKRIALIARIDKGNKSHSGVWNKLQGISSGFACNHWNVDLFALNGRHLQLNDKVIRGPVVSKSKFLINVLDHFQDSTYDIVWIRHAIFGFELVSFLKEIKKTKPEVKVFYEIPTYPYAQEFTGWKRLLVWYHSKTIMSELIRYLDFIVSCNRYDSLFGLPVIHFANGIDTSLYQKKGKIDRECQKLNLIAVGSLWNWFGLDRLIKGLKEYTGPYEIHLHILGIGPSEQELKEMSNQDLEVNKVQITFHGWFNINNLPENYFLNAIGIGTLASHRKNVNEIYSLKHREYVACGMPLMYAGNDPELNGQDWVYNIECSEIKVDIEALICWFETLHANNTDIRNFAETKFKWSDRVKQFLIETGYLN